jgi:hypothetical protein
VDEHVGIGVTRQPEGVGDVDAAYDQPSLGREGVDIETVTDSYLHGITSKHMTRPGPCACQVPRRENMPYLPLFSLTQ